MAQKILQFVLRPTFDGAKATADAKKLTNEQRAQSKELERYHKGWKQFGSDFSKEMERQRRHWKEQRDGLKDFIRSSDDGFVRLGRRMREFQENSRKAFQLGPLFALNHFQGGIEKTIGKVLNLKNAILGTAVGAAAFYGGRAILQAGQENIRTAFRLKQFGGDSGAFGEGAAAAAKAAGLEGGAATNALFPVMEAVTEIQKGTKFRGKTLTEEQAERLRRANYSFGAGLFARAAAVRPDLDVNALGEALANAGTGAEGIRGLVSMLSLNKVFTRRVTEANEKKKLFEFLGAERAAKFGIKKGEQAGQGAIIDLLFQQGGFTEEAAKQARGTLGFQLKQIKSSFEGVIGDIGQKALERVTGTLSKGKTLADQFQEALSSPRGKELIDKLGNSIGAIVEGLIKVATKLPEAFNWIDRNKDTLMVLATAYGGARLLGGGAAMFAGFDPSGAASGVLGKTFKDSATAAAAGAEGGIPVRIAGVMQGAAAVLGAGAMGYTLGRVLDEKLGLSDQFSDAMREATGRAGEDRQREMSGIVAHRGRISGFAAAREARVKQLMADTPGLSKGQALFLADNPEASAAQGEGGKIVIQLHVDGKKMAEVVNHHNVKKLKNSD